MSLSVRATLGTWKRSWQACFGKRQERAWQKVRVERFEILDLVALGSAQTMCSSTIIIEYQFNGQRITQHLVDISNDWGRCSGGLPTHIDIDPLEPTICKTLIEQTAYFTRLLVVSISLIIVCGIATIL